MPFDVPTARANLDRAREALALADLRHSEAQNLRRLHAGATLADSDPEAMEAFAKTADEAETARRAVDNAAIVVAEAERILREAEAAAALDRKRAAAASIHAKSDRLLVVAAAIEAASTELNALMVEGFGLDERIRRETTQAFGDYFGGSTPAFRENLKSAVRRYAEGVNSTSTFAGIYGVTQAAQRVVDRSQAQVEHFASTEVKDIL